MPETTGNIVCEIESLLGRTGSAPVDEIAVKSAAANQRMKLLRDERSST